MAQTTRQTNLLVEQNWTKVYQSFTNADFTSYDFETLRNTMITYLRSYYPETFNDFLESSEYLALIDMIAFLGQSLSFRTDLNARENFIDTAQRRDSILKLARMLNYNPTRTNSASGLIKFDSVSTTENVFDSNGVNLSNTTVFWNDLTNDNWLEQFTAILNASIVQNQAIGKPGNSQLINGVQTDEYSIGLNPAQLPIAPFTVNIQNNAMRFEAVSATTLGESYIYEADPTIVGKFNFLYRNDNNGNGSNNTGFFLYFKQGTLQATNFTIQNAIPNNFVPVTTNNINNTDAWLYSLNVNNSVNALWSQVPALPGVNVIYNQLSNKNLYQINTQNNDQVNLVFGDGSFANIPQGSFRFYFRASNGLAYSITPDDLSSVTVAFSYISASGSTETLTVTASLKYTVTNATASQSLASIKDYAPQQYYTQNRMITGEDYNIFPLTTNTSIQKIKAVNRVSSGVSLYIDTLDPTGNFSSTNIFSDDGALMANAVPGSGSFSFLNNNDIYSAIYNDIVPIIGSVGMINYYYANYPRFAPPQDNVSFVQTGNTTVKSWGNIVYPYGTVTGTLSTLSSNVSVTSGIGNVVVGGSISGSGLAAGTNVSAIYPSENIISLSIVPTANVTSTMLHKGSTQTVGTGASGNLQYIDTGASLQFISNGQTFNASVTKVAGTNEVQFGMIVPEGATLTSIIPPYKSSLSNNLVSTIANQISLKVDFGLTYDQVNQTWVNIPLTAIGNTADEDWLLKFEFNKGLYKITYKSLVYKFASANKTKFYFDPTYKVYDATAGLSVSDTIKILKINGYRPGSGTPLESDIIWNIYDVIVEADGYVNPATVLVAPPTGQMPGVPDDPDLFEKVVAGSIRSDLYFQYKHNSPSRNRIDPTPVNLIDLYILTADYTTNYFNWLRDLTGTIAEPTAPASSSLEIAYGTLNNFKAVSDSLIYNPAKFKPLFGAKSATELQARFQVVINPAVSITPNEVKNKVIEAINAYFNIANWDFGETFYFSELASYLHTTLAPNIASILIVPANSNIQFGNYFQINAEPWEIITSCATVNDVDIISAVTAAQLHLSNTLVGS